MTREDKLYSMKMTDLANLANKLGIKINKKAAKSEAVEKILAAEESTCADGTSYAEVGKEIAEQAKIKAEEPKMVQMPGTEDPNWGEKHYTDRDENLMSKFVKKAQKLITSAYRDDAGYHVTISYEGKTKSFDDKNLQNIRSAIGHIYRGEVTL